MAITERDRRNIFNSLEEAIGTDDASNLMELLPTTPADHLVTREDMHANTALLRGEMAELSAELRGEMSELRAELRGEMAQLRADMVAGFATAKVETQQLIVAGLVANAVAVIAALLS